MRDLKQFEISLPSLAEGHHELELKAGAELFADRGNVDVSNADITAFVDIDVRHGAYNFGITCRGQIDIPCDRCLDPMRQEVDEDYDFTVRYGDDFDEGDGIITIPESETVFDLAPIVADTVLLSIPLRHVHADGECNPGMEEIMKRHSADEPDSEEADI